MTSAIRIPVELFIKCKSPWELSLLSAISEIHDIKGHCICSQKTLGILAMMSAGKVSSTLAVLVERGLLIAESVLTEKDIESSNQEDGCSACGLDYPFLHEHHIKPRKEGGGEDDSNLAYLCPNCHLLFHHAVNYIPYWKFIEKEDLMTRDEVLHQQEGWRAEG